MYFGERRPEGLGGVGGADEDADGGSHALLGIGQEARVRFDRVLEGGAVDLGGEGADAGAGEDRRPHDQMVGEGGVDAADRLGDRAHRGHVGLQVAIELGLGQLRERLDLEPLIRVFDVDRQQTVDVGVVDLHPLDPNLAVLTEQMDLVAEPGQGTGQVDVVDVAAGAAQHVAVEEENTSVSSTGCAPRPPAARLSPTPSRVRFTSTARPARRWNRWRWCCHSPPPLRPCRALPRTSGPAAAAIS
jgi:hypothetical protein